MILTAFKEWAEKQTDYDTLDRFLEEYLDSDDWEQVFRYFIYELYNFAQVFGHMFESIEELRALIEKKEPQKEKSETKKSVAIGKTVC